MLTTFSVGDVDAELHRRRAVQHRQLGLAELVLALLPVGCGTWAVCSRASRPDRVGGDAPVELDEERVDARAVLGWPGYADRVVRAGAPVPGLPADGGGAQLVARAPSSLGSGHGQPSASPASLRPASRSAMIVLRVLRAEADLLRRRSRGAGTARTRPGRTGRRCCAARRACAARGRRRRPSAAARARRAPTGRISCWLDRCRTWSNPSLVRYSTSIASLPAHVVEQRGRDLLPVRRIVVAQGGVAALPGLGVRGTPRRGRGS